MTDCLVLREKLRVPEVSGLARERLERPLLEGPPTALDVVVAPAGSGKTTLLSRVAAASSVPVGWYRITADDSTENRLVAHLAGALSGLVDIDGAGSMAELLGALDQWKGYGGLLILDDLHEIAESPAEKALERFISLRPRQLHLICGSRRVPEVNVPRIRVSGCFREIGSDDLRFRSWEVEELFASVYRQPLRPEAAAALTRRTGGWAAGLQLFHLTTVGRSALERHQAVADLGGRSKLVRSYLTRNVLADLADDRREFLLRTCTLGRLSGEACDALLGASGSHRILEQLENAQLFTFTDDGGMCFCYHEVLQTHLELALVEEYGPTEARAWYLKSAGVLESLGELRSAARAYAKAGDWVSVSRLVQEAGGARIDATVVEDAHLPPASSWQHDPWLALAHARRLVREGALQRAVEAYQNAQTLYDEPNYQQMCRYESQVVSMWLPGYRSGGSTPSVQSQVQHWSRFLRDALRQSPDFAALPILLSTNDIRVRLMHGLAALSAGEIRLARGVLASIQREESADSLATISASLASAALDLIEGNDIDPASHLSTIASMAENEGLPWVARLCHGLEQIALVASHEATWRFESSSEIVRAADQTGDTWGAGLLSFAVGLARQHAGEDATAELSSAARRFNELDAPVLELWCRLLAMREGTKAPAAHQVVETSRTLRTRGAQAWALSLLASVSPSCRQREMRGATELAAHCGIPLPITGATDTKGPHTAIAAGVEVCAPSIPSVAITCFGGYRIAIDGETSTLARLRPQARSVLQILSLSPDHDHHREFLEDLLWPGVDHFVACHRLQVAVSSVRTMLGRGEVLIRRCGESYRLCLPSRATVDVRDFTDALSRAVTLSAREDLLGRISARQEALDLYAGDLLPEITASQHIETERDRLRRSAAAAAAALASDYRTLGDHERALVTAQRSVQLDPYQEVPWLILADLHEKVGDVSYAEYVRREHARVKFDLEVLVP
jgi:DNA-binding SARP family transcriptional activator/tetratricopeptide (TPR) repeat protein